MVRPILISLGLVVSAFAFAACGSSSGESAIGQGAGPSLSMPEYIEQGDAICAEENEKIRPRQETIQRLLGGADTQDELHVAAEEFRELAREVQAGLSRFRALDPPAAQRQSTEEMLTIKGAEAVLAESLADAVDSGNQAKFDSLTQQLALDQEKYRALMQELGFKRCGRSRPDAGASASGAAT